MATAFAYDERCLAHDNGSMLSDARARDWLDVPHVERSERLTRTLEVFERAGVLGELARVAPRRATRAELELVHTTAMLDALERVCAERKYASAGPEARVGPDSWEPLLAAAGGVLAAVEAVLDGEAENAFALVRPPGHHASATEPMGFCLVNNVAIAARSAQTRAGVDRVAIVDWDVHHGNGTESIFWDDPEVLFISLHQGDLYPAGRGSLDHRGGPEAPGATVNVPLPAGTGDAGYLHAFDRIVAPALERFGPDLLLVSAGQDPAAADPLGRMSVTTEGFRGLTARAKRAAATLCGGRLAVALEGGYSLDHAPFCNLAIVEELAALGPSFDLDPIEQDVPLKLREFERAAIDRAAAIAEEAAG